MSTANQRTDWPFLGTPIRRVVVKVGSNVLALPGGGLNRRRIGELCDSLAEMQKRGLEVILVSSGAVAAGRGILKLDKRPANIPDLQAVAAVGQGALMEVYSQEFRRHSIVPAQILLTRDDMADRRRYLNARLAMISLINHKVIPIINENDTVTIDELKFGDNDMLSAMVAAKMEADLLIIMSNVPGLMTGHPAHDPNAVVIPFVEVIDAKIEAVVHAEGSDLGVGGMATKLEAARHATSFGVVTVLVNGNKDGILGSVVDGSFEGTCFSARKDRRSKQGRLHWIRSARPRGTLVIDDGARKALVSAHKSLLPVGIRQVAGTFQKGDVVTVTDEADNAVAQGIVNYDSEILAKIKGLRRDDVIRLLGSEDYAEAIHCDNLVLLPGPNA